VLRRVAADVADWPALIEQARQQNVLGLLASRLRREQIPEVPPEVMAELDKARAASAARALRMSVQLLRLLDLLEGAGIEVMPVKGPTLSQDVYGDPTVRTFSDLDVLVRPVDASRAREVLLAQGFKDQSPHNARMIRGARRPEGEIVLEGPGGVQVDLHWRLAVGHGSRVITLDRLLEHRREGDILGRAVKLPGLHEELLLTVMHGARHEWVPLELRLAAAVQVARLPDAEWPDALAAARELGCLRRLLAGVAHACRPFGVPVPEAVTRGLAGDRVASGYVGYLCPVARSNVGGQEPSTVGHLASLAWRILSEDDASGALEHLLVRGLLPGPEDWMSMELPPQVASLYYAVRPVRLARKHAVGAWRELACSAGHRGRAPVAREGMSSGCPSGRFME
jgi:hypothetical protein